MIWERFHDGHPVGRALADRHYSRRRAQIGETLFAGPGCKLVLITSCGRGLWVSRWERFRRDAWPLSWQCALFRNEGAGRSSDMIRAAVAATRWEWGDPPADGFVTFVDAPKVQSSNPGWCFQCAGWSKVGRTKDRGLVVLQLAAADVGMPESPRRSQYALDLVI